MAASSEGIAVEKIHAFEVPVPVVGVGPTGVTLGIELSRLRNRGWRGVLSGTSDVYLAMRGRFTDPQALLAALTEYLS